MTSTVYRDIAGRESRHDLRPGRQYIAVIGIDRYASWKRLDNAANDARSILNLFSQLGFEPIGAPLFDEMATGDALRRLVTDDLAMLSMEDSLVLFFAGHGTSLTRSYFGGATVKDGYLIPVDGAPAGGGTGTWLRLDSWLAEVSRSPAKHVLVLLDACHSGIALGPIIRWRSRGVSPLRRESLERLRSRRSRRIVTSALDDQLAMDGGPVPGHSLFTGCILEALTGGLVASLGDRLVTGSQIAHYVQRRVADYPGSTQTPDFGSLELDDRGELVVCIAPDDGSEQRSQRPQVSYRDSNTAPPDGAARRSSRWRRVAWAIGACSAVVGALLAVWFGVRGELQDAATRPLSSLSDSTARARATVTADAAQDSSWPTAPSDAQESIAEDSGTYDPGRASEPPTQAPSRKTNRPRVAVPSPLPPTRHQPTLDAGPSEPLPQTDDSVPPHAPSGNGCTKADFAAVYEAVAPTPTNVRRALRSLKICHDRGLLSDDELDRYQRALVGRL